MIDSEASDRTTNIIGKLPQALDELRSAEVELGDVKAVLVGIMGEEERLREEQEAAAASIAREQASELLGGAPPRLRNVLDHVFNPEEMLTGLPFDKLQQIVELDGKVVAAAGQPIVILKPGRSWIDIGRLEPADEPGDATGLRYSYKSQGDSGIVLPVHRSVTFDLESGAEPGWDVQRNDDELRARKTQFPMGVDNAGTRPRIDPLKTILLPRPEEGGSAISDDPEVAYILVGYTQLQQVLNRVLGFNFDQLGSHEAFLKFRRAEEAHARLSEAGITFDMDFIDGYLTYRMANLKEEIEAGGPLQALSGKYQQMLYEEMARKKATLEKEGWLTAAGSQHQPASS